MRVRFDILSPFNPSTMDNMLEWIEIKLSITAAPLNLALHRVILKYVVSSI